MDGVTIAAVLGLYALLGEMRYRVGKIEGRCGMACALLTRHMELRGPGLLDGE